ncbi:MAG TPA: OmpA family protein [Bacteroidales bacterium]|nr:OmpA family protein [Bacteroidales bacterium]
MKQFLILLTALLISSISFAQIDIGGKIKNKAQEKLEQKTDESIDKGFDKTEEGINGVFKKKNKDKDKNAEDGETEENIEGENTEESENVEENSSSENGENNVKLESYSVYDFIPGDKILFFEDFSQDAIGDFPALWTSNSSGEVKTVNIAPGKWFHLNGEDATYCFSKDIAFPDNYIFEFDIIPDADYSRGIVLSLYQTDPENVREIEDALYPGLYGLRITLAPDGWESKGYGESGKDWLEGNASKNPIVKEKVNHVIIWVQKRRVRIYHQGAKVLDVPTNIYAEGKFNRFRFFGWDRNSHPFVTNLKITTASPDMRSKLLTEGKLISYGIYFDSGKDVVKSESQGSLNEIANILKENPDVRIKIVGHTDSDGDDAMNLDLSKRRAANVKTKLVNDFGIDASRIETDGLGESQPIGPNDNPENKSKNRRVEFIKL